MTRNTKRAVGEPALWRGVEEFAGHEPVEEIGIRPGCEAVDPAVEHRRFQLIEGVDTHRCDHLLRACDGCLLESIHAFALVGDVEGAGAGRVLSRNADGTAVGVAHLGLNTANGKHHGAGGHREIGSLNDAFDDVGAAGNLAGRADLHETP
jgi:hypothetical protein